MDSDARGEDGHFGSEKLPARNLGLNPAKVGTNHKRSFSALEWRKSGSLSRMGVGGSDLEIWAAIPEKGAPRQKQWIVSEFVGSETTLLANQAEDFPASAADILHTDAAAHPVRADRHD